MIGYFELKAKGATIINIPRIANLQNLIQTAKLPTGDPEYQPLKCIGKLTKFMYWRPETRSSTRALELVSAYLLSQHLRNMRLRRVRPNYWAPKHSKSFAESCTCKLASNNFLCVTIISCSIFDGFRVSDKAGTLNITWHMVRTTLLCPWLRLTEGWTLMFQCKFMILSDFELSPNQIHNYLWFVRMSNL